MSALREAAQQALEAMNYSGMDVGKFNRINAACAALRAALAQQDEPCPNCASLEAQNTELDRKLAEMEQAYENGYKAGVAAEREACAKVCGQYELARSATAAIRARNNP